MDIQAIFDLTLQRASDLFCRTLYTPDWLIWAVILSISLPHFFYAWLWLNPEPWRKIFGDQAVNAFSVLGAFGKGAAQQHSTRTHPRERQSTQDRGRRTGAS